MDSIRGFSTIWVVTFTLVNGLGCSDNPPVPNDSPAESDAASVRLLDLDGNPAELWPQTKVPITVAIFTRTNCPIANRYAPTIRRLCEQYQPQGVQFYLINVDPDEPPDSIRKHLKEYQYPCRGLRDPQHTLVQYCQATATPEAVVFDRDRSIAYCGRIDDLYIALGKTRPEPTTHDLADAIEATLQGRPVISPRTQAFGCLIADLVK